ncbi:MAG TPA: glycosyl hydrolase family 28 protein [Candidatus Acidoferrales bacterium]|jgi:polygalacturonase|nr:glycosyl hydrolase family 28 protein [Candidatus Acidoferrales bacterium]
MRSHRTILSTAILLALGLASAKANTFEIRDFGATGDGISSDTAAIQKAVDTASQQGGGIVHFAAGQFVTGTILLKDNVTLQLDTNAVLLGSLDIADYQNIDAFTSGNGAGFGYCLIGAVDAKNTGIEGTGTVDGRGKELLAARPKGNSVRPFLIRFVRCDGVKVSGMNLKSPAAWTAHFSQSRNVAVGRVKITSLGLGNNDGLDIDSCRNIQITDCDIDSGDDAICLKTTSTNACRDIQVTGCTLKSHWAGIKFGTESAGNFENITVTDCHITEAQGGGIKLCSVDGANINNVRISDVTMDKVTVPVFIRLGARLKTFRADEPKQPVGSIQNVVIQNVQARATWPVGIVISGIPGHAIENVTLTNIMIHLPGGGTAEDAAVKLEEKESAYPEISMFGKKFPAYGLYARHVTGLRAGAVTLDLAAADARPAIQCEDATNLQFAAWKLSGITATNFPVRFDSVHQAAFTGFGKISPQVVGQGNNDLELDQR